MTCTDAAVARPPEPGQTLPATVLDAARGVSGASGHLLLVAYRGFWCDHCREYLAGLLALVDAFAACDTTVVCLSADAEERTAQMRSHVGQRLHLLSDPDLTLIDALGLRTTDAAVDHPVSRPAAFIVERGGRVRYRYIGTSPADRPTPALLLLGVEQL